MPKNDTPGVEVTITYDDCKSLSHVLLCYGEPSGCRLDDETNESVCGEGECALLAAYKAGATTARAEAEAKDAEIADLREAGNVLRDKLLGFVGAMAMYADCGPDVEAIKAWEAI